MADVILGPAGSAVLIDLDVCAKSGRQTSHRVTLRGSTTPGWVTVLLLFTFAGFLLARAMTSRSYVVTLPMVREVHDRWRQNRRLSWVVALAGVGMVVAAVAADRAGATSAVLWCGLGLPVAALVGGAVNATTNGVGFRMARDAELVLLRAHPDFARAVAAASVEQASR